MTHIAEADRQYAHAVGQENPDWAWILSDRDAWYPNPYYTGLPVPHPELEWEGTDEEYRQMLADEAAKRQRAQPALLADENIPF